MDEKNDQDVDLNNEQEDVEELDIEKQDDAPRKRTPEEQLAYLEGRTQRLRKKLGLVEPRKAKEEKKPDGLDTASYAYLAAKGIEDDEDIEYIHNRMTKWDMSLREVLKDEDVQTKLKSLKIEREVKAATPGSTRRSAPGHIDNVDYWIAKYERTGEYPEDFALKSAVINALTERANPNKPPWMS